MYNVSDIDCTKVQTNTYNKFIFILGHKLKSRRLTLNNCYYALKIHDSTDKSSRYFILLNRHLSLQ